MTMGFLNAYATNAMQKPHILQSRVSENIKENVKSLYFTRFVLFFLTFSETID